MRIAIGQIDTTVGDVTGNVARILDGCRLAASQGARVAIFPELAVCGYPPRDLLNVDAFVRACDEGVEKIVCDAPRGLAVVFGAPRRRPSRDVAGRALFNAAVVCENGALVREVPKALLPTYDVFDERRYFEPAEEHLSRIVEIDDEKIAVLVCEDQWNDRILWGSGRYYDRDPVAEAVEEGATLLVNVSASPFAQNKHLTRRRLVTHAAQRWKVPAAYVNAIGGNDGLLFDGGSLVVDAEGACIAELPWFEEALRVVEVRGGGARDAFHESDPMDMLHRALVVGVRDYATKTGMKQWVLGLSGGVDSALVAAIGTLALGAESGAALAMPSRYSSQGSIVDARALAEKLRLPFAIVPIEPVHAAYEQMLTPLLASLGPAPANDVTFENVQARIRGATLMAHANRTSGLLLTTGNKSECAVGYCTLYGDMCGGLAVIADLYKHEVYSLCRWLNAHRIDGAIPESTLVKPPSAELRPGQRDDQSLPPYDVLDPILHAIVDDELGVEDAAEKCGAPVELVRTIFRRVHGAEYKRWQFPPTLKVSSRAWVGRDYPIAMGWRP